MTEPRAAGPAGDRPLHLTSADDLPLAMAWLEGRLQALGLQGRAAYGMTLSVDEALTNVMTHGLKDVEPSKRQAEVHCASQDGRVVVRIRDNGPAFDPTAHVEADLPQDIEHAGIGGHGVRLIRHYVSDLRYRRHDGWNELTLVSGV
jgi:serine/threonine-protein kinase RsbW